ncbi:MAG: cadherin-like domain-containing protein, partial [Pseudomonadota bacterium]
LSVAAGLGVLANDSDVDGDALTAVLGTDVTDGTLTLNADGSFDYTPDADFNGSDSFTYTVSDGQGGTSTPATVTITVNAVNDDPEAVDDAFQTGFGTALTVAGPGVLANDTDIDGDVLSVDTTPVSGPSNGAVSLEADGGFTYTPDAGFSGVDSFEYRLLDGATGEDTAVVTIDVAAGGPADIVGTPGADRLIGTQAGETFRPNGGAVDFLLLRGGADTIEFTDTAGRDVMFVTGFGADDTLSGIDQGDILVNRAIFGSRLIITSPDQDLIFLTGFSDDPFA